MSIFSTEAENRWTTVNENDYLQLQTSPAKGGLILGAINHNGNAIGSLADFPEINIANLNGIIFVDGITYTTIQSALNALPETGGVVVCPPDYHEIITSPIVLGSDTSTVQLLLSNNVTLDIAIVDHTAVAFTVCNGSSIIGAGPNAQSIIQLDSGAVLDCVIKNGTTGAGGQAFGQIKNLWLLGGSFWPTPSVITTAMVHLQSIEDLWAVEDCFISDFKGCAGILLDTTTTDPSGPLNLNNVEVSGLSQAGSTPLILKLGASNSNNLYSVKIQGGFYNHPGNGNPCILIDGSAGAVFGRLQNIFISTYMEDTASSSPIGLHAKGAAGVTVQSTQVQFQNSSTGVAYKIEDCRNVIINGVSAQFFGSSSNGTGIQLLQNTPGATGPVSITGLGVYAPAWTALDNTITGETLTTNYISSYQYTYDGEITAPSTSGVQFSGNTNLLFNRPFDASFKVDLNAGASSGENVSLRFLSKNVSKWELLKRSSESLAILDNANSNVARMNIDPSANGGIDFSTIGNGSFRINPNTNDGTGGLLVYSGGSSNQVVFQQQANGNALFRNFLNQSEVVKIDGGLNASQDVYYSWASMGSEKWRARKTNTEAWSLQDVTNNINRIFFPQVAALPATGVLRMANTEVLSWRDAGNANDLTVGYNGSDQFEVSGDAKLNKKIASYNGVSTVANGIPVIVATYDATNQSANIGSTTLYAVPSSGAGRYRISAYTTVTTADAVSSTLPGVTGTWTDLDANVSVTHTVCGSSASNTVGTNGGPTIWVAYVKASTNFTFSTNSYASNTPAAMKYSIHLTLEFLGA